MHSMEDGEFNYFLKQVIDSEGLSDKAEGITRLVLAKGIEVLSEKQRYVFQTEVIDEYTVQECDRCGNDVPWSEMFDAVTEDGLCGWCRQLSDHDD